MSELAKYQQIFERDPTDLHAFNNVCTAAEKVKDYEYLTELLKYRTQITGDQQEIVDLLFRAGVVYLEKMNDIARGVEVLLQAFDIDQTHAGIGARLEKAYIDAGDWEAALAIIEGRLQALNQADVEGTKVSIRSDLHQQAGELLEDRMKDNDRALAHFRKAIELDKTNTAALSRAREMYVKLGKFKNAAKLCELEARLEKDLNRKVSLYRELASILGDKMNDKTQAVTALKRALKADQHNDDVKYELARTIADAPLDPVHAKDHKWASDYLTKQAKHTPGVEGLTYACIAIRAYPTNDKAIAVAGAKAKETQEFKPLIAECKKAYATLSDINEQAPLIRRIVKSYLHLGAMGDALAWAEKIEPVANEKDLQLIQKLKESSSSGSLPSLDSEIPEASIELPAKTSTAPPPVSRSSAAPASAPIESSAAAASVTESAAPIPTEPPDGVSFEDWLSQLHRDAEKARRTGDDDRAEEMMRIIVENRPGDQKATTYLERRYRGKEDWRSLRDLLVKCLETEDFPAAVKTVRLRQAAKLAEENLNDPGGAIETWYQIREHDPKVRDAKDALERLLAETERWEELVALYTEEAETTKSRSKKVAAYQRLADIYKVRLNDAAMAAEAYKNVIELAPDDKDAVDALEELYLREQQYDKLVPLLDKRANDARDKAEKKTLILRSATLLQERLGHFEDAYEKAKSILDILPGDLDAINLMEGVDEEAENWERLVETLNLKGRVTKEPEGKIAAYKKVATIASVRLTDTGLALKAWNKVLEVDPADVVALDTTLKLYEDDGEWNELVRILRLRIDSAESDVDKIDSYKKLAAVLEDELASPEEAIVEWQNLLKIEEDEDALGALARWHESKENYKELVEILARQAPMIDDHESRSDVLFKRASIFYHQLGQKDTAVEELKRINTDVNPAHVPTLGLLRDVLVEAGDYEEAVEILEQQIGYCQDKDELKTFHVLLGDWCRNQLSDLGRAQEAYEKAASMDITDDELLDTLDEVFVEAEEWDKLLKMMYGRYQRSEDDEVKFGFLTRGGKLCEEKLSDSKQAWGWYRQLFDNMRHYDGAIEEVEEAAHRMSLWNDLIDVYSVLTKEGTDSDKVVWWLKIATILEEKVNDPSQALEAVLRAFGLEPDNEEMLDSVDRLAVTGLAWDRLATVYAVLAKRAPDADSKIEKYLRHAKVLFEKGEQPSMAFDVALKAFELDPSSESMLTLVEEIGAAAERFEELVKVYKVCADREEDISRKVDLLLRSAATCKENLDDGDGALERTLDALVVSPFDDEVVAKVWTMVRDLEADLVQTEKGVYWNKLIDVYRQLSEANRRETEKQVGFALVISKIYAEELQEKSLAFDSLKDAQALAPNDENTIDKLEEMAGELDMWDDLVEHYRDILDETFEMNTAVMYHRRRARILSEQLGQSEEAAEHYWQIIQLDAQDERAYAALLEHYQSAEKWNDLVNLLERQLDAASDDSKRQALLLQIAEIWENKIGNKYEAKDWYEQVVTIWPDNEQAIAAIERLASTGKIEMGDDDDDELDEDMEQLVSIAPPPATPDDDDEDEDEDED
ncbi:MAG: tetratricopeptide repeat protein, partial [Deltaproteobacteria bacterium]|nr:tetratricopeptide repeat protein [Deltaproteobacteria bacterium]MBN2674695.1 tetratricopeptide repeat protein [Deltaproteobacteria bacterium]